MEYFFNFEKLAYVQGLKTEGCIFCEIVAKGKAQIDLSVYDDDLFKVMVNLYPYNPGHLLIIPRRHIEDVRHFTETEAGRLHGLTKRFLDLLDSLYRPSAYNIGYNMGSNAGASIPHLHLHIIPRYPREIGIADLLAGKRVLVESPSATAERLIAALAKGTCRG